MQSISRLLLLIITISASALQAATGITKERMLQGMVSNHTRIFSKDDLFAEQLSPQEWYRYLTEVKKYVADNGGNDQKLNASLEAILTANDNLINSIKVTYGALFAKDGSYQDSVAKSSLQKFNEIMADMATIQKNIIKEVYFLKGKKETRELLEQLALFTELTAQKASNDLRKRMNQAMTNMATKKK